MKYKILFIAFVLVIVFSSIGSIYATDMNIAVDSAIDENNSLVSSSIQNDYNQNKTAYVLKSSNDLSSNNIQGINELSNTNLRGKLDVNLTANDTELYFQNGTRFKATLTDNLGNPLSNQSITFSIHGMNYIRLTDNNGVASIGINLNPGNYPVKVSYAGTDVYKASEVNCNVKVLSSVTGKDIVKYFKNGTQYYATFVDSVGNPLVNRNVTFNIYGVFYKRLTNASGVARLNINLAPGEYILTATNPNDDCKYSNIIKVLATINGKDILKEHLDKSPENQYYATFVDSVGNPLVNRNVTFNIYGVFYKRLTNASGVARLNINLAPGKYILTAIHPIDGFMYSNTIMVLKNFSNKTTKLTGNNVDLPHGMKGKFDVVLTSDNAPLVNMEVKFTVVGVTYVRITDYNGVASLNINLNEGEYPITYKFDGIFGLSSCEGSAIISIYKVNFVTADGNGYWVQGRDMYKVNLPQLNSLGTSVIFLNSYAFSLYGESKVLSWIQQANKFNIKVHIWMQAFYNGGWISPLNSDGSYNYNIFNERINNAKYYAGLNGVLGIHLDYLRFPGTAYKHPKGTEAINEFVKLLSTEVRKIDSNIVLSAAVMPETNINAYYYGQDVSVLGKYLDVIVPMVYKGNYNSGTSWITKTTQWFVSNSAGAKVWSGLQTYNSDNDITFLSISQLKTDAQAALNGGASGVVMFRWGVTNFIDFKSLDYPHPNNGVLGATISLSEIKEASSNLKKFIESNGVLPSSITLNNQNYSVSQFLYMMSKALLNLNAGSSEGVKTIKVLDAKNVTDSFKYGKITKKEYISIAKSIVNFVESKNTAPDTIDSSLGKIKYTSLVYMYSKVLGYINTKNIFPAFVFATNLLDNYAITVTMYPSASGATNHYKYIPYTTTWLNYCPMYGYYGTLLINPKGTIEGELTCAYCDADFCGVTGLEKMPNTKYSLTRLSPSVPAASGAVSNNLSIDSILSASEYLKGYIEVNDNLLDYVTIDGGKYSVSQVLYLMTTATVNINNKNFLNIEVINVTSPSNSGGSIINSYLNKAEYLDVAQRVSSFIVNNNNLAPNYASSTLGKISYEELVDAFSRILTYYKTNNVLPSTVKIVNSGGSVSKSISDLSVSLTKNLTTEISRATALFNYVRDNINYQFYHNTVKGAEGTLIAGMGNCCDQAQLLVALARANNLTVRFATGECTFSSGKKYGHVWTQFKIDGKWYDADPTSARNSFNVIRNWNTASYISKGTFEVLPY